MLQTVTDPAGDVTQFAYYVNRRGFQVTDATGNTQSVSHDIYRNRTDFTDERGKTSYFDYDSKGRETQQLNPDRTTEVYHWYDNGLKQSEIDAYGQTESYVYSSDGNGNLTQLTNRLGKSPTTPTPITATRTPSPASPAVHPLDGAVTQYFYYTASGAQNTTHDQYGADYCLWKVIDALGNVTTYTYPGPGSNCGLPTSMTAPKGQGLSYGYMTWYEYNDGGQVTAQYTPISTQNSTRPTSGSHTGYILQSFVYDTPMTIGRG